MSRCASSCQECTRKMSCAICGKQLCYSDNGASRTRGHYVFGDEVVCVECNAHKKDTVKK